jgi:excisionase family DNA binding protein
MSAPSTSGPPPLNGASAAAAPLGVSKQYVRSLIAAGRLLAIRLGMRVLIPKGRARAVRRSS